jgi:hypothetical protein
MQPMAGYRQPPLWADPTVAKSRVKGPSICLLIFGAIWLVFVVIGGIAILIEESESIYSSDFDTFLMCLFWAIYVAIQILIIVGANHMRKLRSYPLAMTSCILSLIPFISSCYFAGIPFAIWGLVAITNEETKSAFRR